MLTQTSYKVYTSILVDKFWMEGVRQCCPLSGSMFTLLLADLEKKVKVEKSKFRNGKSIYTSVRG